MASNKLSEEEEAAFRKFIVIEEEGTASSVKQPNTKPQQMSQITAFVDSEQLSKAAYASQWDILATKLNNIGPPMHSGLEWRRIWTVHKSNIKSTNKKRMKLDSDGQTTDQVIESSNGELTLSEESSREEKSQSSEGLQPDILLNDALPVDDQSSIAEGVSVPDVLLDKLNDIIDKQNQLIRLVTSMFEWMKT